MLIFSKGVLAVLFVFLCFANSFAEEIIFNSGEILNEKIIARQDDYIKVEKEGGFSVTYYLEDIKSIDGKLVKVEEITGPIEEDTNSDPGLKQEIEKELQNEESVEGKEDITATTKNMLDERTLLDTVIGEHDGLGVKEYLSSRIGEIKELPKDAILEDKVKYYWDIFLNSFLEDMAPYIGEGSFINEKFQKINNTLKVQAVNLNMSYKNFLLTILGVLYFLVCFPMMLIARKLSLSAWVAWIPVLQIFLFVRMAEASILWVFFLFVPVFNIFIYIIIWVKIVENINKPAFLGFLMVIPGFNILLLWYLALAKFE